MDRRSIATATLVIMLGTLTASAVGFARAFFVARYFGAGIDTDAFFAALIVSQVLLSQLIGGAITAVLIPTFSRLLLEGEDDFWVVVRTVFAAAILLSLVLVGLLELLAHPLMIAIVSGFELKVHGDALSLSVTLVRVLLPTLLFSIASAVAMAALYALGRRMVSSFAPSLFHAGIIAAALLGATRFGITALAVGAVIGAVLQFAVQVPSLLIAQSAHRGSTGRPAFVDFHHPALMQIVRLYLPVAGGVVVGTVGYVVEVNFKSHLPENGGLSSMQYAMQLIQFPVGLVATALAFAVLPAMSRQAGRESQVDFSATLSFGMRTSVVLMAPAMVGSLVLATPVTALVFQRGEFTSGDTMHTADALIGYAPMILLLGINQLLIYAFYARHNTMAPMLAGAVGVGAYVILAFALVRFTIVGLALSETIAVALHTIVLYVLVMRDGAALRVERLPETTIKVGVAGAGMAAATILTARYLSPAGSSLAARLGDVAIPGSMGLVVYIVVMVLLQVETVPPESSTGEQTDRPRPSLAHSAPRRTVGTAPSRAPRARH